MSKNIFEEQNESAKEKSAKENKSEEGKKKKKKEDKDLLTEILKDLSEKEKQKMLEDYEAYRKAKEEIEKKSGTDATAEEIRERLPEENRWLEVLENEQEEEQGGVEIESKSDLGEILGDLTDGVEADLKNKVSRSKNPLR